MTDDFIERIQSGEAAQHVAARLAKRARIDALMAALRREGFSVFKEPGDSIRAIPIPAVNDGNH